MTQKSKSSKVVTLILMILAMNTIYMLPYLMYTYYTPLQEAMGLIGRDADYGRLLNVYGIANVILYLPGGWVADKFDCKKLLIFPWFQQVFLVSGKQHSQATQSCY